MSDKYLSLLSPWEYMIDQGMTTFGETDIEPRSDCHAWSASPLFEMYHTVAGIQPLEPGFKKILIEPNLGHLKFIKVNFALPNGEKIIMDLVKSEDDNRLKGSVQIPKGSDVIFRCNGQEIKLSHGHNLIH